MTNETPFHEGLGAVQYKDADTPPSFVSSVKPEEAEGYKQWLTTVPKEKRQDSNYDLAGAYNSKSDINSPVDNEGMVLMSPYHPDFHKTIENYETKGNFPYMGVNGRIYLSNIGNDIKEDKTIPEVEKLPTLNEIKSNEAIAQELPKKSDNIIDTVISSDVSQSNSNIKKSSSPWQDIAYMLPLQEARDKYKASELNKGSAKGPHQFELETWHYLKQEGIIPKSYNINNINHTTEAAAKYLEKLGSKFNNQPELALAAYNWGPGKVNGLIKKLKGQGIEDPSYSDMKDSMPKSVVSYIENVGSFKKEDADNYHSKYNQRR